MTSVPMMRALLTPTETAAMIGCSMRALEMMRAASRGPAWRRVSPGRIGYVRSDVERWLREEDATPKSAG